MEPIATANEEAIEAWNGPLFDRFVQFRHLIVGGLAAHGNEALRLHPPAPGDRVLDIGCGFGDTTAQLAALVGPEGHALGNDAAPRFIASARAEFPARNVRYEVADLQAVEFDEQFDYAFSRFGTMFFASPVAALRNVRRALVPGGRLTMVVWRRKLDNDWIHRAELTVKHHLEKPEESDEPTCGPGPFSMANADMVTDVLMHAGFEQVELRRSDLPLLMGGDLDEAVALMMSLGPAGEVLRLLGSDADHARPTIDAELHAGLADFVAPDGAVYGPASTWIVSAVASEQDA